MGSFQQVTLGLICLAAAFAFGNYVNNNPSGSKHPAVAGSDSDSTTLGNIHSRLAASDLIPRQAAPISTMRNSLQPRFKLPTGTISSQNSLGQFNSLGMDTAESELPPPSQLNRESEASSNIERGVAERLVQSSHRPRARQVPDFSQIAAEFKNTPVELPKLGTMPSAMPPARENMPIQPNQIKAKPESGLRDLAAQFSLSYSRPEIVDSPPQPSNWNQDSSTQKAEPLSQTATNDLASRYKYGANSQDVDYRNRRNRLSVAPEDIASSNVDIQAALVPTQPEDPFADRPQQYLAPKPNANEVAELNSQTPLDWKQPGWNRPNSPQDTSTLHRIQTAKPAAQSNRVKPRAQIGGIDFNIPPPEPSDYRESQQPTIGKYQGMMSDRNIPRTSSKWSKRGSQQLAQQDSMTAPQNARSPNRVRTQLPFKLTNDGEEKLARLTSQRKRKVELETTRFRNHNVEFGETLQSLSTKYFGRPEYYLDIYLANRNQMRNPSDVREGMRLRIPVYE